jgi:ABC-2 type transport system permease protein
MRALLTGAGLTFARQARQAARDPGPFYVLPMLPALLMTVVFIALFERIATLDRFGDTGYAEFLLPGVVVLVALLGAGATSASLAADLRGGFFHRLRLLPAPVASQLLGRLLFEAVRLLPGAAVVLAVGLAFGGRAHNGLAGMLVVVLLVALLGVAFTGVFYAVAIRTRDPQTPFTLQPLGLPLSFLSSALVPLAVMPQWARTLARANPVTVVVDGSRQAMLGPLWSAELGWSVVVLAAWTGLGVLLAWAALRREIGRS